MRDPLRKEKIEINLGIRKGCTRKNTHGDVFAEGDTGQSEMSGRSIR